MPLFEFRCGTCHTIFEALCRNAQAEGVVCPECGGKSLSRLLSRFAINRQLTPCGTPAPEAAASCGFNARTGGCSACQP
jgi:putative FmdB family regulatory protein